MDLLTELKKRGDANGDGKIDFSDAQGILDKVNMLDSLSGKGKNKGGILGKLGSLFGKK